MPMPLRPAPISRASAASISAWPLVRGLRLERGRARLDAEAAQELRLHERPVTSRAHGLDGVRQRLEIDMGGEVDGAGRVSGSA